MTELPDSVLLWYEHVYSGQFILNFLNWQVSLIFCLLANAPIIHIILRAGRI